MNVIHPGPINTPAFAQLSDEQKAAFVSTVPMGRAGQPREVATAALFLASADSSYITGISMAVDGGTTQV
ncbi:SDR family oxidoreductase [Hymenobacter sp. BT523]|nr:SDR family oxidoreductase [Hymenobacter sp. BT523]